ncbi:ABC transmembrane type-1 domain-containing protein [Hyphomicrobiales bacterium]|nr:ABC transmembrane type-1 domain-containing protein [Hyphomicrobiales bacterium]CAH1677318.1 ABC transmembrane type-1 domain-containing protein [Hyphomicrobiales bacterium]
MTEPARSVRTEIRWGSEAVRRFNLPGLAVVLLCIALWELYSRTLGSGLTTFASVSETMVALRDLARNGPLLEQLFHTLSVALVGWLIATLIGLTLGAAIGIWRPVWVYSMATIDVLRSIPSISLVSIALMIFGFSSKMEMVIVVYVSQWPVLLATAGGIQSVPASYLDTARALQLSRAATVRKILLPAALPEILVGARLALTLSMALAIVAEMVGNPAGLGFGLVFSQQALQPAQAFAYFVVIGAIGWGLNAVFVMAAGRIFRRFGPAL